MWSPDGTRIVFGSSRSGTANLYVKASDGAGSEQPLFASEDVKIPNSWSPDGRFLLFTTFNLKTQGDLWILPMSGDRKPTALLQAPSNEGNPQFSPDGRWLAYASNESGATEVYVQAFTGDAGGSRGSIAGGKWQVSTGGGLRPVWRRDGKELFYFATDGKIMAVAVQAGARFESGIPKALFQTHIPLSIRGAVDQPYDVTADGQRFLVLTAPGQPAAAPLNVVLNWTAELKP